MSYRRTSSAWRGTSDSVPNIRHRGCASFSTPTICRGSGNGRLPAIGRFALGPATGFDRRWAPSHGKPFTARRSGLPQSRQRRRARPPTVWLVEAWNKRMLGFQGPAQPSPALGDAINAGYGYLEVKCLGCNTHQTVALNIVRRPKSTPIHELERYMRCKDCSRLQGRAYKRSHLVALRPTKISADDPASTWWPGER